MKIAIHQNEKMFKHESVWIPECKEYCREHGIECDIISCYSSDIINKLKNYDAVLWTIQNYVKADTMEARSILNSAKEIGLKVFPDFSTSWHFDDKIAETYLLQAIGAPIPKSWVFYMEEECINWLEKEAKYPLVAKLRCGSGSNNVKLLKNFAEAKKYAHTMFTKGLNPTPGVLYKAYSKMQSSKSIKMAISRIKKLPDFLRTRKNAKRMGTESGYCYFQEFIENNGYDMKIVVIGDKLIPLCRNTRKGDWRASGGGDVYTDISMVTEQILNSAFETYDKCRFQCIGLDYVVNKNTGKGLIIEMCYGFDFRALSQVGGYFDREGNWHEDKNLSIPREIIHYVLNH
ncbi:MAG: hypothetical protein IJA62_03560 [Ruminococcus sp.]|nr:hypothetical protein [Ruminococcus sp.]